MARRGRCRCGNILVFHRGPQGYKMRCPQCLAVVRLNAQETAVEPKQPGDDLEANTFAAMHFLELDNDNANSPGSST
jgi:hypothetical protein